ncbi:MAG TPA: type VI secretion system baseplate subunit TssK [Stellaceae bacterium]|nr:type VI secretion system baseplate subunit TssK [Stellaceae bacterium]
MSDLRAIPEAVQWHEGMLLSPQHFQQAALRSELLLAFHLARAMPFHWGVLNLQLDQARLTMGNFRVLALQAILPDGLAVTYPHGDAPPLELDLLPLAEKLRNTPTKIYLAAPARRPDIVGGTGETARYRSVEGEEVVDQNTGDSPMRLPRLRPNLMLLAGERPSAKYTAMPIAEVSFANDTLQLTPDYVPPMLAVPLDGPLGQLCLKLAQSVRQKASFLADRAQGAAGGGRQASLLETRSAIHCLVAGLPPFEAALNTGEAHPFALFVLAAGIAGQLAPLGPGMMPPIFERYDHDDIAIAFRPVLAFIDRVVETISELHMTIAFTQEGNAFRLRLKPAWLDEGDLLIGARGRAGASEADVAQWLEESLIGDSEQIQPMMEARIRGAARTRVIESEALGIVPTRGTLVFRVAADRNFIAANRVLEVANPRDTGGVRRPLEIVLYVRVAPGR